MDNDILLEIESITIKSGGQFLLPDTDLVIKKGDNFLVTGPNGSGKTSLMRVITGDIPVCKGSVKRYHSLPLSKNISYISFENSKKLFLKNEIIEESEYYSGKSLKADALDILGESCESDIYDLSSFKNRKITDLSSGELRKFEILKTLSRDAEILILDEPFDGLDRDSKVTLQELVNLISNSDIALFLVTHRVDEIPDSEFKHISIFDNGVRVCEKYSQRFQEDFTLPDLKEFLNIESHETPGKIVEIRDCSVSYGSLKIFSDVNLIVNPGEKWVIKGENGCGKSTLAQLITGDHLQCYSNEIRVFGKKRGSGETIWDIKRNIGYISPKTHLNYNKKTEAGKVVLSGFFDSTGLYEKPSENQVRLTRYVFEKFNITGLYYRLFNTLSYGEQRIILILRALIKNPELIIMDEPCHGLDNYYRSLVLNIVRTVCKMKNRSLIYISHSPTELDFKYTHVLSFHKYENCYTTEINEMEH